MCREPSHYFSDRPVQLLCGMPDTGSYLCAGIGSRLVSSGGRSLFLCAGFCPQEYFCHRERHCLPSGGRAHGSDFPVASCPLPLYVPAFISLSAPRRTFLYPPYFHRILVFPAPQRTALPAGIPHHFAVRGRRFFPPASQRRDWKPLPALSLCRLSRYRLPGAHRIRAPVKRISKRYDLRYLPPAENASGRAAPLHGHPG